MPTEQDHRPWRSSYAILGVAGIAIATLFAIVASLANGPVNRVQPFPDMPGPVIADSTTDYYPTISSLPTSTSASATVPPVPSSTTPKPKPKPKPSTTQAALPPQPAPPPAAQAPIARFTVSCARLTCGFDGTGSSDPDGSVIYWAWGFGDGSDDNLQNRPRLSHRYRSPGTYTVTLVVLDEDGTVGQVSRSVRVSNG